MSLFSHNVKPAPNFLEESQKCVLIDLNTMLNQQTLLHHVIHTTLAITFKNIKTFRMVRKSYQFKVCKKPQKYCSARQFVQILTK